MPSPYTAFIVQHRVCLVVLSRLLMYTKSVQFGGLMREIKVTELRNHLPAYLAEVQKGEELRIVSRGKIIARLIPEEDQQKRAKALLAEWRKTAWVGDVTSPLDVNWEAGGDSP
jgi:prevent-host-death family protein